MPACILTLMIFYPLTLGAGVWFFMRLQRINPHPVPEKDPRYNLVKPLRFMIFVVLLPLAFTLSLAVLGLLDPLFYLIRDF